MRFFHLIIKELCTSISYWVYWKIGSYACPQVLGGPRERVSVQAQTLRNCRNALPIRRLYHRIKSEILQGLE